MTEWWNALSALQQMFLFAAVPFTVILIIQVILTIIGLGHDSDMDTSSDIDAHAFDSHDVTDTHADGHGEHMSAAGFRFFTIRGLVAFFCIFGWTGYAISGSSLGTALEIIISAAAGLVAMLLIGLMFYAMKRMQQSGNLRYSNAVGLDAEVYLSIPPSRSGKGKVMVAFQERLVEAEAMTDNEEKIPTGAAVRVVGNVGSTLIVKR